MQEAFGDDAHKQFQEFVKKTERVIKGLPLIAANEAKVFFQDNFRRQAWVETNSYQPWKKRKPGAKRNEGRAILTDTGRGKRSIRVLHADWNRVEVGINDAQVEKYMGAHNTGFRGTVRVGEFSRIATRKVATRYALVKTKRKGMFKMKGYGKKKIRSVSHQVKSHLRRVNFPKRQFIGNSTALDLIIDHQFTNQLKTL